MNSFISQPRNPILIKLFRFAKLGENAGYGIRRMKNWTALTGGQVDFESAIAHTTVTYWRTEKSGFEHNSAHSSSVGSREETGNKQEENGKKTAEKTAEKIVSLMLGNPIITTSELASSIGISVSAINQQISKLKKVGLIRREGPDKGGHWVILK